MKNARRIVLQNPVTSADLKMRVMLEKKQLVQDQYNLAEGIDLLIHQAENHIAYLKEMREKLPAKILQDTGRIKLHEKQLQKLRYSGRSTKIQDEIARLTRKLGEMKGGKK